MAEAASEGEYNADKRPSASELDALMRNRMTKRGEEDRKERKKEVVRRDGQMMEEFAEYAKLRSRQTNLGRKEEPDSPTAPDESEYIPAERISPAKRTTIQNFVQNPSHWPIAVATLGLGAIGAVVYLSTREPGGILAKPVPDGPLLPQGGGQRESGPRLGGITRPLVPMEPYWAINQL